jgi:GH25 family lysozyme M1 (1,4-beta-N-acetylmuramidase)
MEAGAVGPLRGVLAAASAAAIIAGLPSRAPVVVAATTGTPSSPSTGHAPTHPDLDYMGSTIAAHEPTTGPAPRLGMLPRVDISAPGLDVSHYQGTVDWTTVAADGAKFAYLKATEGTTFVDPQFAANYPGSANAGLDRGAYHFALPDTSSGAAQANYFLGHGGGWVGDGHTLPPVLDIEYNPYGATCYGLTPAQMVSWINDFDITIDNATNRWPVIYTTQQWWASCTGDDATVGVNDPLWIAHASTVAGPLPAGWGNYTFWQFASSGPFPGDQDLFNASIAELAVFTDDGTDKIVAHYNAIGGASSYLGSPSGGEYPVTGGWAQNYANGTIYYSPATGAWAVHGGILAHYQQLGGPGGVLGFPVTDETGTPDGVGRYNHFSGDGGSSIYWTPNTGAWSIHGAIRAKWAALGWERGPLGYPTTDETGTPDGVGRFNHFSGDSGSSIYWTPSTGAWSVGGAIQAHWASLGWERGPMGYPVTDETGTPDGIGRYNHFSAGASIYWTPGTGAWSVRGAIRTAWASLGWERGRLGYPTSDEYSVTGGRRNDFQHGTITWTSATGAVQVVYS